MRNRFRTDSTGLQGRVPSSAWRLAGLCVLALLLPLSPAQAGWTYTGDLTITTNTTWDTEVTIEGNLTLADGATLTLEDNFVHTVTGNLDVELGATLDASGQGYSADQGSEAGESSVNGSGGGHGGSGGLGGGNSVAGAFDDSSTSPSLFGSGGGSGVYAAGAAGGGVIRLRVGGSCVINGEVRADGASAPSHPSGGVGGGGAGGTIDLACGTLLGSGLLTANGGDGGSDSSGSCCTQRGNGGGGGGGRIVVRAHDHSDFTSKTSARVDGGNPGTGPGIQGQPGSRGTMAFIAVSAEADTAGTLGPDDDIGLEIYQGWRWQPSTDGSFDYGHIYMHDDTQVVAGDGDVTLTADHVDIQSVSWNTSLASTHGTPATGSVTINAETLALTSADLLADPSSESWTFDVSSDFSMSGGTLIGQELTLTGSSEAIVNDNAAWNGSDLSLEVSEIIISGTLNAEGRGYAAQTGPGAGESSATGGGGGGGHGREGGPSTTAAGGARYGVELFPSEFGSGGGNGKFTAGGAGGGRIGISATGQCAFNSAFLNVDGASGVNHGNGGVGGGGSGGSLLIQCETLSGTGASFSARGGAGGQDILSGCCAQDGNGGGGGGGRIALHYTTSTLTGPTVSVDGGSAPGGPGPPGSPGEDGTFFDGSLPSTTWVVDGVAEGGTLSFTLLEIDLSLTTTGGETASEIAAAIAGAIAAEPGLLGISAEVTDATVVIGAPVTVPTEDDAGYRVGMLGDVVIDAPTVWSTDHHILGDLIVESGGALQLQGLYGHTVTGNLSIEAGSTITADGQGYASDAGAETGASGVNGGGGGHGGAGGASSSGELGGAFQGRGLMPFHLGSGGGSGAHSGGGTGGGVVRLAVGGLCVVNGSVSADGLSGAHHPNGGTGGGGSGGTINLVCETLTGGGSLSANGGAGGSDASGSCCSNLGKGGGGAGGRIVVRAHDHSDFTSKASVEAEGGPTGSGPGANGLSGGRGTVAFIRVAATANPLTLSDTSDDESLEIYRGWRWENSSEAGFQYQTITIQPDTVVVGGDGDVTIEADQFSMSESTWESAFSSSNGVATEGGNIVIQADQLSLTETVVDTDSETNEVTLDVASSNHLDESRIESQSIRFTGNASIAMENLSVLTARSLVLEGSILDIGPDVFLSTAGRGHASDEGDGAGGATSGGAGAGAGHGATGGNSAAASGGTSYGSSYFPVAWGSGGGSGQYGSGGAGGGAIAIEMAGACVIDGILSSDGAPGQSSANGGAGGGGSGGSVAAACDSLQGSGIISAKGGGGGSDTSSNCCAHQGRGGGGAGGRIALRTASLTGDLTVTNEGGQAGTGPGSAGSPGGSGVLALGWLSATTLTVDGVAEGGDIGLEIEGVSVEVSTSPGESAESVAAALAAAILAHASLPGLHAEATDVSVVVQHPVSAVVVNDNGLWVGEGSPPEAVPVLREWGLILLGLALVLATGVALRKEPLLPSSPP